MKYSYYPGCTLKTKAKELNDYAIASAKALGIEMEEIEDWQCCGGVFVSARDEIATKLSSVRALSAAARKDQPLVTVCSACHNVIKQTNHAMVNDENFASFFASIYANSLLSVDQKAKILEHYDFWKTTLDNKESYERIILLGDYNKINKIFNDKLNENYPKNSK